MALVVTIVVLLILAGITIMYTMGENSVFKQASDAKVQTELAKIEEQAGTIYSEKFIQKQTGEIDKINNRDIIDELISKGNAIEIRSAGEESITGISVIPTSVTMDKNETAKVKVSLEGPEDGNMYYAIVDGKYYKINFQNNMLEIERKATTPEGNIQEPKTIEVETGYDVILVTNIAINQDEKTIEMVSGVKYGNTIITVKYGNQTASCNVTVEEKGTNWEEMNEIAKEIAKDESITNSSTQATVTVNGENKTIKVGEIYKVKYNGEIRRVRVLGFKHDDLVDEEVYGGRHTKASISFEFYDFMTGDTYMQMNTSNTNSGGWGSVKLRTDLNGSGNSIGGLGANLNNKAYIKQVKKKYIPTYNIASTSTCNDYLWLLACSEVVPKNSDTTTTYKYAYAVTSEGNQYQYYKGLTDAWNAESRGRTKCNAPGSASWWWLRSPGYSNTSYFCYVNTDGYASNSTGAIVSGGVAPGFCI